MAANVKTLKPPISDKSSLTTRENIILLQSAKLHGCIFPPWTGSPSAEEFEGAFEDSTVFPLSETQSTALDCWKRPENHHLSFRSKKDVRVDLVQDITSDCSVVASLCAESARAERLGSGHESIIFSIMYPKDESSANGKYVFKFYFNGCDRRVVIDDRLPVSKDSRTLHVFDRSDPSIVWPALVEKAYLKVRGGYDFPGSNSGTDLLVLSGWIPEQLFLQSEDIAPNAFWKRLYNAFEYGDVLVTVGTGKLSFREEKVLGLAGEHAYAIIDMKEEDDRRLFLVKNPWSEGQVWTGSLQHASTGSAAAAHPKEAMMPGTFWMDLNSMFQYFDTIYLNWNPGLFAHRKDVHFLWDLKVKSAPGSFDRNPQYLISSDNGGTVWLLLSKHFKSRTPSNDPGSQNPEDKVQPGYLSLYAFETAHRVVLTDGSSTRTAYVDAPNILLRFELPARTPYLIVVSEQDMPALSTSFSLSAFSISPLTDFRPAQARYTHSVMDRGAWTASTAGGNASSPNYNTNPQFQFTIPTSSDVAILLELEDKELAVHVKLVWAGGNRIQSHITTRDIFGDSGEYRRGCALAEVRNVIAGTYTVVCSTFYEGRLGKFTLSIRSMSDGCTLKPIPIEEAGMLVLRLPAAAFSDRTNRLLAPLKVSRITKVRINAKCMSTSGASCRSPMKVSIEYGQGPNKRILVTSGEFTHAHGGLRTTDLHISPKQTAESGPGVWLVVERAGGSYVGMPEEARVEVLSGDHGVTVGPWGIESDEPIENLQRKLAGSSLSNSGQVEEELRLGPSTT